MDQSLFAQGTTTYRVFSTPLLRTDEKVNFLNSSLSTLFAFQVAKLYLGHRCYLYCMQIWCSYRMACCNRGWTHEVWEATHRLSISPQMPPQLPAPTEHNSMWQRNHSALPHTHYSALPQMHKIILPLMQSCCKCSPSRQCRRLSTLLCPKRVRHL